MEDGRGVPISRGRNKILVRCDIPMTRDGKTCHSGLKGNGKKYSLLFSGLRFHEQINFFFGFHPLFPTGHECSKCRTDLRRGSPTFTLILVKCRAPHFPDPYRGPGFRRKVTLQTGDWTFTFCLVSRFL